METSKKNNRRSFFLKFFTSGLALFSGLKTSKSQESMNKDDMVKMLSSNGQIMLVPKSIVKASEVKNQTKNVDILKWREGLNNTHKIKS